MNVSIEDIRQEDAKQIALWKSDPLLSQQLLSDFQQTDELMAAEWIRKNSRDENQCLQGIYVDKDGANKLVGVTRLMYMDFESLTAEFGIYIGDRSNRNQGLGGCALDLMLKKAFNEMSLEKVYLKVVSCNENAIALYLKKNFRVEGTLRQHSYLVGEFHDVVCMAIFKGDMS